MGHIIVLCATCDTSGTNIQMVISQQGIVEMLRKLAPRVIQKYGIQILNQNSYILGKFVVDNYLVNELNTFKKH